MRRSRVILFYLTFHYSEINGFEVHCLLRLHVYFSLDVVSIFESLSVLLYADDMKLYAEIGVIEDCYAVQRDLDRLCAWCDVNKLDGFNLEPRFSTKTLLKF
jgi:hypothetical protein